MRGTFLLCSAVFALRIVGDAGDLNEQWSLDLSIDVKTMPPTRMSAGTIFGMRFSPDGRHIAVLAGVSSLDRVRVRNEYLLIVPINREHGPVRNFLLNSRADDISDQNRWSHFDWTLRGDSVLVGGELIRIDDTKGCPATLQSFGKDGRLFLAENYYANENQLAQVMLQDASCDAKANWKAYSSDWIAKDISLERGLVCLSRPLSVGPADLVEAETARVTGMDREILVFDPVKGKVIQEWPPSEIRPGWALRFGSRGKFICGGGMAEAPVRCWDVDSGKRLTEASAISGGMPMAVSSQGDYVVASDFRAVRASPFSREKEVLRRRVIWNITTSKEIVSWHPQLQTYDLGMRTVNRQWSVFAISPKGDYLAEAGDGTLRFYAIKL